MNENTPTTGVTLSDLHEVARWIAVHLSDFYAAPALSSAFEPEGALLVGAQRPETDIVSSEVSVAELSAPAEPGQVQEPAHRALCALLGAYVTAATTLNAAGAGAPAARGEYPREPWEQPTQYLGPVTLPCPDPTGVVLPWAAEVVTTGGEDYAYAAEVLAAVLTAPGTGAGPILMAAALAGVPEEIRGRTVHPLAMAAGAVAVTDGPRLAAGGRALCRDIAARVPESQRVRVYSMLAWLAWVGGNRDECARWVQTARATGEPLGLLGDLAATVPTAPWRVADRF